MKKFKSAKLSIAAISAIIAVLSCSSDIELPPSYEQKSSSSSSTVPSDGSSSSVVHGGGSSSEVASSSSEAESSSGTVPSSSSVEPSSSSILPSSSSVVPSSSSVMPSSSSVLPSSSSVVPSSSSVLPSSSSSSSVVPCTASDNTETHYCSVGTLKAYGSLFDSRNDKTYKTVVIGNQTWMAENLNYAVEESKCYGEGGEVVLGLDENYNTITKTLSNAEVQANCDMYGRLYNWNTASSRSSNNNPSGIRGICPEKWHLPSKAEWEVMTDYIGGEDTEGKKLKATRHWEEPGNGTDDYGFSALPGGNWGSDGFFRVAGRIGDWWSTSYQTSTILVYVRRMHWENENASWIIDTKSALLSVRCVKDEP